MTYDLTDLDSFHAPAVLPSAVMAELCNAIDMTQLSLAASDPFQLALTQAGEYIPSVLAILLGSLLPVL